MRHGKENHTPEIQQFKTFADLTDDGTAEWDNIATNSKAHHPSSQPQLVPQRYQPGWATDED